MAQVVAIDTKTAKDILTTLQDIKREVARLRKTIEEPPYGSKEWWEWSDKKALEDYKKGNYTVIRNKTELKDFFDSLENKSA